jgi:hypothetical protein
MKIIGIGQKLKSGSLFCPLCKGLEIFLKVIQK